MIERRKNNINQHNFPMLAFVSEIKERPNEILDVVVGHDGKYFIGRAGNSWKFAEKIGYDKIVNTQEMK